MTAQGQREQVNILIVDDRPANLVSLEAVLQRSDYRLVRAASGEEALARVLREEFAVILLDVAMPGLGGVEAARLIKQRERSRHIPILFVTATVDDVEVITRAYEAGAVDYLHKPVEPALVRAKVAVFVELYRQRKQIERQAELLRESARREQAHELRRREAERRRFLDEASAVLLGALDSKETLGEAAEVVVPRMADLCAVYLRDEEGMHRAGLASDVADEEAVALAFRSVERGADSASDPHPIRRALQEGVSRFEPQVGRELLEAIAEGEEEREALSGLELNSLMAIPLSGRGRTRGLLVLGRCGARAPFGDEHLSLAEELGRRAAIAVDNAQLYRDTREAVQLRDEFLSIASHELRTPLTALQLYLQVLQKLWGGEDPRQLRESGAEKLRGAVRQTERLARLVENLLDVSRITTGRFELHREQVDLAALVGEVVERFREEASRAGCELLYTAATSPRGTWDRLRLEQVLDNLLSNALKYAPGHPVEISVEDDGAMAKVRVRDEGIGISEEDADRIFGRFERAVPSRHYGGLGLGLYIAQQIVGWHGGRIGLESQPRKGSTFVVQLPLGPVVAEAASPGNGGGPEPAGGEGAEERPRRELADPQDAPREASAAS